MNKTIIISLVVFCVAQSSMWASENAQPAEQLPARVCKSMTEPIMNSLISRETMTHSRVGVV